MEKVTRILQACHWRPLSQLNRKVVVAESETSARVEGFGLFLERWDYNGKYCWAKEIALVVKFGRKIKATQTKEFAFLEK